ncbi:penicillin-binding protein 2 [Prosthecobacter sp.]|uniref:penicillin-binding protein 2 n=1 Tax=Prosthecobacter sp. TaxID=1965333 RepID=UPI002ABB60E6|nr:penicillin-binding protein 2 [Prosthecobacter sp.]MDZ4404561.1 penicillin-binding protein 2 [Prosthecobacter sp.]
MLPLCDLTMSRTLCRFLAAGLCALTVLSDPASAQVVLKAQPVVEPEKEAAAKPPPPPKEDLKASWQTQREARALTLSVPAPRGQIVDRHGIPFAQNRAANYLALVMPYMEGSSDAQVTAFARSTIDKVNQVLGKTWSLSDERVLLHYKHRRWLPLVFSVEEGLNVEITPDMEEKLKSLMGGSLVIQPAYLRHYPQGTTACHIIGYTGKTRPLPTGPIVDGDPVFEEMEGREGIETAFDSDLKGQPGIVNVLFSPDGKRLSEDVRRPPSPGRNVVLSIDYNFQKYAENALRKHTTSGAMVIMDVTNGDILAMASNPGFDLNEFVPGIRAKRYEELTKDPRLPLYPRAFRGEYPPASTFKIVTALGALDSGKVNTKTYFDCDNAMEIGNRVFKNWNKEGEGSMTVVTAIKRSCNTWFYRAALESGADYLSSMALRLGFGERTGIPLKAEGEGFVQSNAWTMQQRGHKMLPGDIANMAIGQGMVLATPLQVCQCMAGLGDGARIPQPRLVLQIQDLADRVVMAYEPKDRKRIDLNPDHRQAVINGMVAVVNGSGGTGHSAAIKQAEIAGKTGTAQWKIAKDQNLAWFTGFLPAGKPMFAFAVVYEGEPGEDVSGGRKAAPIVREVFTNIFEKAPADDPMLLAMKDVPKATIIEEEVLEKPTDIQVARPAPPPPPEKKGIGGFFRRLFGR